MEIVVDLLHPAHLNFFVNAIGELEKHNIGINIIYRTRGEIKAILEHDLPGKNFVEVGRHYKTLPGKLIALFHREYQILKYLKSQNFDLTLGVAGFYIGFPAKLMAKSSITFSDDWEYKTTFYLSKYSSDYLMIPKLIPANGQNILKYNGYKELAYLHPNYYKPKLRQLKEAGFTPGKFIFIRLVSSVSLNYYNLTIGNLQDFFKAVKKEGYDIVVSTEESEQSSMYSDTCHILEPPVEDIHSWQANAALTVSFGDTIARESCLLGTPTIYLGGRDMAVNSELISMGCLIKATSAGKLLPTAQKCLEGDLKSRTRKMVKEALASDRWIDTTRVIVDTCRGVLEDDHKLINKYREIT
jgi:predicted glycosyltransferase